MFDFVWHLRGSVCLNGTDANAALDRVEQLLQRQRKRVSKRGSGYLAFDDPLWRNPFGPNWLALVIYDRGRFWVEKDSSGQKLRYDLRSLHGIFFCLFAACIAFFFGLAVSGFSGALKFAGGAFAWLYGMNVLLALVRVPFSIRKAVKSD